jgi:hypothetical protein
MSNVLYRNTYSDIGAETLPLIPLPAGQVAVRLCCPNDNVAATVELVLVAMSWVPSYREPRRPTLKEIGCGGVPNSTASRNGGDDNTVNVGVHAV